MKLIAIDLDGTLLRDDKSYDKALFQDVLNHAQQQDIALCIATGNTFPRIKRYFKGIDLEDIYLVSDNGTQIYLNDRQVFTKELSEPLVEKLVDELTKDHHYEVVISTGQASYGLNMSEENFDFVKKFYPDIITGLTLSEIPRDYPIIKLAIQSPKGLESDKETAEMIQKAHPELEVVTSGYGWFDIYHDEAGKGNAILKLQDRLAIDAKDTIAFGDSMNDAGMMRYANYAIAMEDADEELLALCHYQIGSNNDQAVLTILKALLEEGDLSLLDRYKL